MFEEKQLSFQKDLQLPIVQAEGKEQLDKQLQQIDYPKLLSQYNVTELYKARDELKDKIDNITKAINKVVLIDSGKDIIQDVVDVIDKVVDRYNALSQVVDEVYGNDIEQSKNLHQSMLKQIGDLQQQYSEEVLYKALVQENGKDIVNNLMKQIGVEHYVLFNKYIIERLQALGSVVDECHDLISTQLTDYCSKELVEDITTQIMDDILRNTLQMMYDNASENVNDSIAEIDMHDIVDGEYSLLMNIAESIGKNLQSFQPKIGKLVDILSKHQVAEGSKELEVLKPLTEVIFSYTEMIDMLFVEAFKLGQFDIQNFQNALEKLSHKKTLMMLTNL